MHVTVVGAGALGRVYGVNLAAAGATVDFLVRASRLGETDPFVVEEITGAKRQTRIESPRRVAAIAPATEVVIVTVRFDQLDAELVDLLSAAPRAAVVVVTPMLPAQRDLLLSALGRRVVPAMPGVSGYSDDRGVVRYWVVSIVSTLLDDPGPNDPLRATVDALARELTRAHLPARLERDVGPLDGATTISFFPFIAAIDAGGGIDGALADKELVQLVLDAARECDAVARTVGKIAAFANLLFRFAGPYTIKPGVGLARRLFPESVRFVEAHFGNKLHAQHLAMGQAIVTLAASRGVEVPALTELCARLRR